MHENPIRLRQAALVLTLWLSAARLLAGEDGFSSFLALRAFGNFARTTNAAGEWTLLSPALPCPIEWNELIVSWNARMPTGAVLKVEAQAIRQGIATSFYTLGLWSPGSNSPARSSVPGQHDSVASVDTDTLTLAEPADAVRVRFTLAPFRRDPTPAREAPAQRETNYPQSWSSALRSEGAVPEPGDHLMLLPSWKELKFVGLSLSNTRHAPISQPPNRAAWGKIIRTPERSQLGFKQGQGWCSPAAISMVLARWSDTLRRPELNLGVPEVAAEVTDPGWGGTGNWPFNTALAGSFSGMRAYVTRFSGIHELEDWVAAGIPVILSSPWHLLKSDRPSIGSGHLVVCLGFTKTGDLVINDPAGNLLDGRVRQVYRRANVSRAWATSHNTVYLIYPESAKIPQNRWGHWESVGS